VAKLVEPIYDFDNLLVDYKVTELPSDFKFEPIQEPMPKFRTKKAQLVLVGGKAGVGKTTAANYLLDKMTELYPGLLMEHTAFAKPIKEIAYSVFHWDGNKDGKGRRLLQVIGTEAGREYNENIWVEYLENNVLNGIFMPYFVFVDDWRFLNEKEYFEKNLAFEVTTIRIESEREKLPENTSTHASENSLPTGNIEHLERVTQDSMYDFVVYNNETIKDFYKKLDSVVGCLRTKIITY
jgi:GTPase SAR1 family protein